MAGRSTSNRRERRTAGWTAKAAVAARRRLDPGWRWEPAESVAVLEYMEHERLYDEASKVQAEEGEVLVDGPDGIAVSLTPDAAIETSERLLDGGLSARGQQVAEERRRERHQIRSR